MPSLSTYTLFQWAMRERERERWGFYFFFSKNFYKGMRNILHDIF